MESVNKIFIQKKQHKLDQYTIIDTYVCTFKVRINKNANQFLIKPLGLACHEVTASSLVKIDANGKLILFQNNI